MRFKIISTPEGFSQANNHPIPYKTKCNNPECGSELATTVVFGTVLFNDDINRNVITHIAYVCDMCAKDEEIEIKTGQKYIDIKKYFEEIINRGKKNGYIKMIDNIISHIDSNASAKGDASEFTTNKDKYKAELKGFCQERIDAVVELEKSKDSSLDTAYTEFKNQLSEKVKELSEYDYSKSLALLFEKVDLYIYAKSRFEILDEAKKNVKK